MFYEVISGQKRIYSVTQGEVNTFSGMVSDRWYRHFYE